MSRSSRCPPTAHASSARARVTQGRRSTRERRRRRARAGADRRAADGLELLECNPVLVHPDGAVVVDATAKEVSS